MDGGGKTALVDFYKEKRDVNGGQICNCYVFKRCRLLAPACRVGIQVIYTGVPSCQ